MITYSVIKISNILCGLKSTLVQRATIRRSADGFQYFGLWVLIGIGTKLSRLPTLSNAFILFSCDMSIICKYHMEDK